MALVRWDGATASVVAALWWHHDADVWRVTQWHHEAGRSSTVSVRSPAFVGVLARDALRTGWRGKVDGVAIEAVFVGKSPRAALKTASFGGAVTASIAVQFGEPIELSTDEWRGAVLPEIKRSGKVGPDGTEHDTGREAAKAWALRLIPGRVQCAASVIALAGSYGEHVAEAIGIGLAVLGYTATGGKRWRNNPTRGKRKSSKSSKRGARTKGRRTRASSDPVA